MQGTDHLLAMLRIGKTRKAQKDEEGTSHTRMEKEGGALGAQSKDAQFYMPMGQKRWPHNSRDRAFHKGKKKNEN